MPHYKIILFILTITFIFSSANENLKSCGCNNGYPVLDSSCNSKVEKCFGCKGKYYLDENSQSCIKKPTDFKFKFVSHADNMKISKNPTKISARGQGHLSAFTKLLSNSTSYYLIHFRIHEYDGALNQGECVSNGGMSYVGLSFNFDSLSDLRTPFKTGGYGYQSMTGDFWGPEGVEKAFGEKFGPGRVGGKNDDVISIEFYPDTYRAHFYRNGFLQKSYDVMKVPSYRFTVSLCGQTAEILNGYDWLK